MTSQPPQRWGDPAERAARMASRPLWQRILIPIGLLVAAVALPINMTYDLVGVERVDLQVESCDFLRSGVERTYQCRGSWQLADGRTATGSISSVGRLTPGDRVEGWGNAKRATTSLTISLVPLMMGGLVVLGAVAGIVLSLRLRWRARRGR
ncbi:hypothetical protein ACNAW0_15810 [Micromonospora sp. SL1-18]|uniref:hypothetical protein n=1 Tax=Micromonospora sp. SL1-18 TaxID=3399128 RepID=UPI003A4DFDD5